MKHLTMLMLYCLVAGLASIAPETRAQGQETPIVVRIYPWDAPDPSQFTKVNAKSGSMAQHTVALVEQRLLPARCLLVVAGDDQQDAAVRQILGRDITATVYPGEGLAIVDGAVPVPLEKSPIRVAPDGTTAQPMTDALGRPLAGARVVMEIVDAIDPFVVRARLSETSSDNAGRFASPGFQELQVYTGPARGSSRRGSGTPSVRGMANVREQYRISHPDVPWEMIREGFSLRLPIVPKGSPAAARALRGRLLDAEGRPVPGAYMNVIACNTTFTTNTVTFYPDVVTDAEGRFNYYYPEPAAAEKPGGLLPEHADYLLTILTPLAQGYPRLKQWVKSGQEVVVRLPAALPHPVSLIDTDGSTLAWKPDDRIFIEQLIDPASLPHPMPKLPQMMGMTPRFPLDFFFKPGGVWSIQQLERRPRLPAGRYQMTYFSQTEGGGGPGGGGRSPVVTVTDDGPTTISFPTTPGRPLIPRPPIRTSTDPASPAGNAIRGRLLDAETSQPLDGALVVLAALLSNPNADMVYEPKLWEKINAMPKGTRLDPAPLQPLRVAVGGPPLAAQRTDANGRFQFDNLTILDPVQIMAIKPDYFPRRMTPFETPQGRRIANPTLDQGDLKMYRYAWVTYTLRDDPNPLRIVPPTWIVDQTRLAPWADELRQTTHLRVIAANFIRQASIPTGGWMHQTWNRLLRNRPTTVKARLYSVPADVPLRARVEFNPNPAIQSYDQLRDGWAAQKPILLRPNEVRNLGTIDLRNVMSLRVRVMGPDNTPLAKVMTREAEAIGPNEPLWFRHALTDEQGTAEHFVAPDVDIRIGVFAPGDQLVKSVIYKSVEGSGSAPQLEIHLTADEVARLRRI